MKKKIIISLILAFFCSCTQIMPKLLDTFSNKMIVDKDRFFKNYIALSKDFIPATKNYNYEFKAYKYKNSIFHIYKKEDSKNLVVYVHGGAFINTNLDVYYLRTMEKVLDKSNEKFEIAFLDVKGNKYPKQTDELDDLLDYITPKYEKVILMGDSSGGNIILSTLLRRKDEKKKLVDALVLFSPWTDLTNTVDSRKRNFDKDILFGKTSILKTMVDNSYVKGEDLKNPYISPIFGVYDGFSKTYIQCGSYEMLEDDSLLLYENMKKAKVDVRIDVYKKMFHVFQLFGMQTSNEALLKVSKFVDGVYYDKGVKDK